MVRCVFRCICVGDYRSYRRKRERDGVRKREKEKNGKQVSGRTRDGEKLHSHLQCFLEML